MSRDAVELRPIHAQALLHYLRSLHSDRLGKDQLLRNLIEDLAEAVQRWKLGSEPIRDKARLGPPPGERVFILAPDHPIVQNPDSNLPCPACGRSFLAGERTWLMGTGEVDGNNERAVLVHERCPS